jgi:hypothetical protein
MQEKMEVLLERSRAWEKETTACQGVTEASLEIAKAKPEISKIGL